MVDEEKDADNNVAAKVEKRKRGGKKGGTSKKQRDESEEKKPKKRSSKWIEMATPVVRPARERKSVERFTDLSTEKTSASKGISIEKGSGTQLKDIPNVAFKLSKRKPDETLQMLHTILYGRRSKTYQLKRNINQFSGFVWVENEEKRRARVKEKIDKCIKDKLLDVCDVLDIPVSKATIKKEELSAKLLEFLQSPHATTEVSLAEKEQLLKANKRKRSVKGTAERSAKKSKKSHEATVVDKGQKRPAKAEEKLEDESESADDEGTSSDAPDGPVEEEESDHIKSESDEDEDTNEENDHREGKKGVSKKGMKKVQQAKTSVKTTPVKKSSPAKLAKGVAKSTKGPSKSVKAEEKVKDESESADDESTSADAPDGPVEEAEGDDVKSESEEHKDTNEEKDNREGKKGATKKGMKKGLEAKTSIKTTPVKKSSAKLAKGPAKSVKGPSKSVKTPSGKGVSVDDSDSIPSSKSKELTTKVQKENKKKSKKNQKAPAEEKNSKKKEANKAVVKVSAKEKGKGKAAAKAEVEPSREELLSAVTDILKEVDFNTATLSDILRQLGVQFDMDLMHRKNEVKNIIEEVINSMTDDEEGEENEEEDGGDAQESEEEGDD